MRKGYVWLEVKRRKKEIDKDDKININSSCDHKNNENWN